MTNVRIPQIHDLKSAIRLYYGRTELSSADIRELFGELSTATISRLKRRAREQMVADNVPAWNAQNVNTASAFTAWGLNISDLENRYAKLRELNLS